MKRNGSAAKLIGSTCLDEQPIEGERKMEREGKMERERLYIV
jgi:hypothetical protein